MRISPNILERGVLSPNMGFAEIDTQKNGAEGFRDSLAFVSDSLGTYSCLSLGTSAANINGELLIGSGDFQKDCILTVRGSAWVEGDLTTTGELNASRGSFNDGLSVKGEISITGHRIEIIPTPNSDETRGFVDFTPKPNCVLLCNPDTMGYEPYDFTDLIKKIEALAGKVEDLQKLFDTRYVRQDAQRTVQVISSVDEYPETPDAYTLYLKRER